MFERLTRARIRAIRDRLGPMFQLFIGLALMGVVFAAGIAMFMLTEGWDFTDSFYMVVITLSTVGFGEVHPLSDHGRFGTAILIICGVGNFAYILSSFSRMVLEGQLHNIFRRRRVQRRIDKLENHCIVCGYGRIGSVVAQEMLKTTSDVVVIESRQNLVEQLQHEGVMHVQGDATDDHVLIAAGLKRAKSIITTLTAEADNVYVTLTARQIKPDIFIVTRVNEASHVSRLELAGANKVVMPHLIGGLRMANSVLRPTVTEFIDLAMNGNIDLHLEQLQLSGSSRFVGQTLIGSHFRQDFSLIIVGIKRATGELVFNPGPEEKFRAGDTLITVGRPGDLARIEEFL